ncbi:MAG: NADH-quinone oxidoreductase subunit NuoN [Neomegalonema sp.]|nr:NADH-quinone oxidoreductase subunit NuoN [Neomegalonema sp.]
MSTLYADLAIVRPEIVLAIGAMILLVLGVFRAAGDAQAEATTGRLVYAVSIFLLLATGLIVIVYGGGETREAFGGMFVDDAFARYAKVLILFSAALIMILGLEYLARNNMMKFEYPIIILFAVIGMMMMVSANDLLSLYMGLELQSLSLYIIAAFRRDSVRSTEAGLKYFVLGALSSGLLLYGMSLVYGFTGSTSFDAIAQAVTGTEKMGVGLLFGLSFMAAGFAFKISAAPFHMWTPDVYEGAPMPVTALFATAPKVAAGAMFARAMVEPFGAGTDQWQQILAFLAVASMFLGAVAGIGQTNIKRLMAYSSIGHMGFALVGLAAGGEKGVQAMLVYLAIYVAMNVGVFAFLLTMTRNGKQAVKIADLAGLGTTHPAAAACVAILMFSLAGIPPLAGFFAKYFVLNAAVDAGLSWLAIAGVIASVISAFYYLRIVKVMYFDEAGEPLTILGGAEHKVTWAVAALLMLVAIFPFEPFNGLGTPEAAERAAQSLDIIGHAGVPGH